jgi:hypothetical protein
MAERKKVERKPIAKVEPKKRVEPKPVPKVEPKKREVVEVKGKKKTEVKPVPQKIVLPPVETSELKVKRPEHKYVRLAMNAPQDERRAFGERVQKGELKIAYYAAEGDTGYHYYIVLKK